MEMPRIALLALAYAATLGVPLQFWLATYGLQRTWPSVASIYGCVQPISSSVMGALVLGKVSIPPANSCTS